MNTPRPLRLRHRMLAAFVAFTVLVTAVFGTFSVLFAYAVEDQFIAGLLEKEARRQSEHHRQQGVWAAPRESWMRVIDSPDQLPDAVAARLEEEPDRVEFAGRDGRHYHLASFSVTGATTRAWVIGEVSELLVIRPQRDAWLTLLAGTGLAMVALALALGAWLARRTTASLSELAAGVDASGPEDLSPTLDRDFGRDEAGILARALQNLLRRVRAFAEREREFSRDASHELRTPLTVIRNACAQLGREPGLPRAAQQSVQQIQLSAGQLEQTVDILLLLAREDSAPGATAPVALLPKVEQVVVEQASLLDGKPVELVLQIAPDLCTSVPPPALNILLANLIGNAFAHTDRGRVLIEADAQHLRVSNPGATLPAGAFDAYVKGEASAGLGLGLSIVRRLCERYGLALSTENAGGEVQLSMALHPGPSSR